ncbi:copper resistance protein CopD [Kocuria koreensis]|jgi:cytochrome c oxidase assembly factor CtaG/putative copper export protein|uniref:Copper resistance protein CopD n=1 Tax=Rothia koreensis TaxID=592378 RepID=A0A7K1LJ00_9MICC|nr:cytochrome c oxidase assembly protein [Rothia koreensis]MUN55165.1 copper resistance protein CopD [Rothia koreensis]
MTSSKPKAGGRTTAPRREVPQGLARGLHRPWLLVVPGATLVFLVVSLILSGTAAGTSLNDPGPFVRWALPVATSIHNISMAATMGALVFTVFFIPRYAADAKSTGRRRSSGRMIADSEYATSEDLAHASADEVQGIRDREAAATEEYPPFVAALNFGAVASMTWTIAAVAVLILSYADVAGTAVSSDKAFTSQLLSYMQSIAGGQEQTTIIVVAAVVTTLIFAVRQLLGLLLTLGVSMVALVALALSGHSSGGDDHMGAVNSLGLHLLGVSLWFGGLVVLAYLSRQLSGPDAGTGTVPQKKRGTLSARDRRAPMAVVVLRRYSAVALAGFVMVLFSGIINADIRIYGLSDLGTTYGALIVTKAALTLLLGIAGAAHRLYLIPRVESGAVSAFRGIWQVILAELVIMGTVSGVAVTLSRSAPPVPEELKPDASPARIITWYEMPGEPTTATWFTTWRWDWLWVAVAVLAVWFYVWAFLKVRSRGGNWNPLRLVSWIVGLAFLTFATSGSLPVYSRVLFSAHMVEHMLLTMIIPIFLVLGAPVTLFLRALEPRQDGTRGPREWILWFTHSTWSKIVTNPIVAAVNFAGSIVIFYFTPLFGVALRYHVGHEFMMAHFLLTGYMFLLVLIGIDPIPRRPQYAIRLVVLIATLGYHAFVGIALMSSNALLQASWFGNVGRPWGLSALGDQKLGGSIMWGMGEIPTMLIAVVVGVQWSIADGRLAKRIDRQADRDGDAELEAYNEMFERLNEEGTSSSRDRR